MHETPARSSRFWAPRCEGCGRFVRVEGSLSDYRWCDPCADALPLELWRRRSMVSRLDAQAARWRMWPMSDIARAA